MCIRDRGGIIVIDFIDMDERKNRNKVMQALEDELKLDRAPSKVLQFNDFGLVAITRKRVKQSLERTLSTQCAICAGTGMVKSPTTVCNEIYIEMRKMQLHLERQDVLLRVHPEVVKTLKLNNARWLNELEEMLSLIHISAERQMNLRANRRCVDIGDAGLQVAYRSKRAIDIPGICLLYTSVLRLTPPQPAAPSPG